MTIKNVASPVFLSVCIPSFNRPGYLKDLLQSIALQDYANFEVVVCDDASPLTQDIEKVVAGFTKNYPDKRFRFIRNPQTLGYDGNFRGLIEHAKGDYCVYMGDDDLLCPGALSRIACVVHENPGIGVILRSWAMAERETKKVIEEFRYFDGDRLFEPGIKSIKTLFRRSVAIAGYTINRKLAAQAGTERFDGTLLYQLYLTGIVAYNHGGYYISDRIAIMRKDQNQKPTHFFGTAEVEKKRFKPGKLPMDASLNFVEGMVEIAEYLSRYHHDEGVYKALMTDLANYSYPLLSVQRDNGFIPFIRYFNTLRKLGVGTTYFYYLYFFALLLFGRKACTKLIVKIKKMLGRTPALGDLYSGKSIETSKVSAQ